MLTRSFFLAILITAAGCSPKRHLPPVPPAELPGGWKLSEPAAQAAQPDLVKQYGGKSRFAAVYTGSSDLKVTFYEMPAEAVAFELSQKWRSATGTLFFNEAEWFVTIEAKGEPYSKLSPVVAAVQSSVKAAAGKR